jgi:hypothetical protein
MQNVEGFPMFREKLQLPSSRLISLRDIGSTDRLCGLVVRVPGYTEEMYCASCEVQTEFIYCMLKTVDRLCGLVVRVPDYTEEMYCAFCEVQTEFIYVM